MIYRTTRDQNNAIRQFLTITIRFIMDNYDITESLKILYECIFILKGLYGQILADEMNILHQIYLTVQRPSFKIFLFGDSLTLLLTEILEYELNHVKAARSLVLGSRGKHAIYICIPEFTLWILERGMNPSLPDKWRRSLLDYPVLLSPYSDFDTTQSKCTKGM